MSPEAKHAASDSLIALIQPFVDDELAPAERARVEAVLAEDPVLRDMVDEQRTVRQVLRDMSREAAPQALQARVLLELDAVDRERAAEAELHPAARPARPALAARLRSFLRGAAVMVPAGATALALFLVTRTGTERHVLEASPTVATAAATAAPLIVGADAPAGERPAAGVRLVGAALPGDPDGELGEARSVIVKRRVGARLVLDRHQPAGAAGMELPGPSRAHEYRGRNYWLGQVQGRPAVAFESDGVRHTLSSGDDQRLRDAREYMLLLSLGHALRDAERPR